MSDIPLTNSTACFLPLRYETLQRSLEDIRGIEEPQTNGVHAEPVEPMEA